VPDQLAEALDRIRTRLNVQKPASAKPLGRILAILGSRGGAGATTLAVHLGCFLVKQHGKKTLILDEHRRLGHVSLYLGESDSNYHFYELVQNIARLDEILLQGFVLHHSSCLDILPSPDCFDDSANVSLDDIQRAIRFLGQNYEFVVIDCPHGVHNLSLATIDCCDELYLVATPDVPALRDLSRCIDRFLQSNVPPDKIKVVINRLSSEGALGLEQIEKAIRQPIAITIPNASSDLIRAMNTGSPVLPDRKSEFAVQIKKWAASLVPGQEHEAAEPKRRFAFWN
jgi:pilus assembly protein CpaE